MRKLSVLGIVLLLFVISNIHKLHLPKPKLLYKPTPIQKEVKTNTASPFFTSLFFPYWTLPENIQDVQKPFSRVVDEYIYFGVAVNTKGIVKHDTGYAKIELFNKVFDSEKNKTLCIRYLDTENISQILYSENSWKTIAQDSVAISQQYNFSNILLDIEYSGIPTKKIQQNITKHVAYITSYAKKNNISVSIVLFGDSFFHPRAYNVAALSKTVNKIYIMAYDFHKSKTLPGPLFPHDTSQYGYSFSKMIDDFTNQVDMDKIIVVLGLYGYDWIVDTKNRPIKPASAISLNKIENKLQSCMFPECSYNTDAKTHELTIIYTLNNQKHIIWGEHSASIQYKINLLKENRLNSIGFWAYGYY